MNQKMDRTHCLYQTVVKKNGRDKPSGEVEQALMTGIGLLWPSA